ncbi:serine protease hepsin-like [Mytilus edulis]|uniref:serine protease hepsin-like n=1 Tax=Mytilus edulis TaxID=6550 RepID=UPI0039EEC94F
MAVLFTSLVCCVIVISIYLDKVESECGISDKLHLSQHRIVGGQEAQPGTIPWIVMLTELGDHVCGGSIIGDRLILTAAHCFEDRVSLSVGRWKVIAGKHNVDKTDPHQREFSVQKIIMHSAYDSQTVANDLAILVLQDRIIYDDYIKPACLPDGQNYYIGQLCITAGWGDTQATGNFDVLNQVELAIISDSLCVRRDWYGSDFIPQTTFCAGYSQGGKDSCGGDSGGPFTCKVGRKWIQMGVTSWGILCGAPKWPGIYTDITRYMNWIRDQAQVVGLQLDS